MADGSHLVIISLQIFTLIYSSHIFPVYICHCLVKKVQSCDLKSVVLTIFLEMLETYNRGYFTDLWSLARNFTSQGFTF